MSKTHSIDVCYVTIPNYPTVSSGKGQDRYAFELIQGARERYGSGAVTVSPLATKSNYLLKQLETVSRLRRVDARIYHATSEFGLICLLVARKKPVVVSVHDLIPRIFFSHSPLLYATQLAHLGLIKRASRIIVSSQFYAKMLGRIYGLTLDKIDVVYYGVDHELFRNVPGRVRNDVPKVLYLGGLTSLKGVGDVVEGFASFSKESKAELIIAGRGNPDGLKELALRLGIADRTTVLGFVSEAKLPGLYNSVDVVVWPSHTGFGLSILEAMSCGTPVVAADSLDTKEYLGDGGSSYCVRDIDTLGERLNMVLQSEESWQVWSENASKWSWNFSWGKMVSQVIQTYEKAREL